MEEVRYCAEMSKPGGKLPDGLVPLYDKAKEQGWCCRPRDNTSGWSLVLIYGHPNDGDYQFHQYYDFKAAGEFIDTHKVGGD